ncbi:SRPBCC family protein [Chitinophagaceae bacterium MMS25-I14]
MKAVKHTWFFNQPQQEVWNHLTTPELLEQWLMKNDFLPVVGHKFYFVGECEGNHKTYCEVTEITPYSRVAYSWLANSMKDGKPYTSMVVWTLTPKNDGTELQLVHDGFTVLEDAQAHNDGWTRIGQKMVQQLNAVAI